MFAYHLSVNRNFIRLFVLFSFQVTAITNYKRPEPHPNYTEIIIDPPYNVLGDCMYILNISNPFFK